MIRPWSQGSCPTADDLRSAWYHRRDSAKDFVWFLSILGELACFADYSLQQKGGFGNIAGRAGGLKGFLAAHVPELLPKYKSISRYATLVARFKRTFGYYPPATLSLMHPELPLPRFKYPFIINFARKLYRDYFAAVLPRYVAWEAVIARHEALHGEKHAWLPPAPQDEWAELGRSWYNRYVRPKALAAIRHDSFGLDGWFESREQRTSGYDVSDHRLDRLLQHLLSAPTVSNGKLISKR